MLNKHGPGRQIRALRNVDACSELGKMQGNIEVFEGGGKREIDRNCAKAMLDDGIKVLGSVKYKKSRVYFQYISGKENFFVTYESKT